MVKQIIYTAISGLLAVAGLDIAYSGSREAMLVFVIMMSLLALLVCVGGIVALFRQETIDFREIYREKDRLQKEKIHDLESRLKSL